MAGIYFHIPFCKQACHYCDFHFSTNQQFKTEMVAAIQQEINIRKDYLQGERIKTLYFGGGTPSVLLAEEIKSLLDQIHTHFEVDKDAEITLEANPDDLTSEKLSALRAAGINRLSIGIQSFHTQQLQFLNRAHDAERASACVMEARAAGFDNISIDLIYAIPDESDLLWIQDIEKALSLAPEHISCYSLTIEPQTVFGKWAKYGKLKITEDEVAARHLEILMDRLEAAGYEHYEVSNFAKPGYYSKHNSSYWQGESYLGLGPSAHSYNKDSRQFNLANNHRYMQDLKSGIVPYEKEVLSDADKINEYILTSLRTSWGCDTQRLQQAFQYNLLSDQDQYIQQIIAAGYAELKLSTLVLTKRGKLLADKIASDLFISI